MSVAMFWIARVISEFCLDLQFLFGEQTVKPRSAGGLFGALRTATRIGQPQSPALAPIYIYDRTQGPQFASTLQRAQSCRSSSRWRLRMLPSASRRDGAGTRSSWTPFPM